MDAYIIQTLREFKNPTPDGRNRDAWNKQKTVPAGMRFIVRGDSITSPSRRYVWEYERGELGKAVLANSEVVRAKSIAEIKAVLDVDIDGDVILAELLKLGLVTVDDLRGARDSLNARWQAEEAAEEKRRLAANAENQLSHFRG
jgi:hypothetical protein